MPETQPPVKTPRVETDSAPGHLRVLADLSAETAAELYAAVERVIAARPTEVVIDLSPVQRMDSLGGAWLSRTTELLRQAGIAMRLEGAQGQVRDFVQLIRPTLDAPPLPPPSRSGLFETLGDTAFAFLTEARDAVNLLVDTVYWAVLAPCSGKGLRWKGLVEELALMGVRATLIVLLMNALLGFVIALMSAAQLRQFGAGIFVADLVAIAFARELAPMMTAVVVAARSGSAIAAELATMVVQEEIDALHSMGFNTAQFLVAPKFWALILATPLLTVLAMFAGTFGGLQMGVFYLGIDPYTWIQETLAAVTMRDVLEGLSKSVVYGGTIVVVGCHNGLRVRGGAQGVGLATTRAVVMDVVLIVILDMIFALLFEFVFQR